MELKEFGVFDIMMRAMVILGVLLGTFSHFMRIRNNRRENEVMKLEKYYNNFFIQNIPLYSTYAASVLTGLALFRFGSILKVNMSSTPSIAIANIVIVPAESFYQFSSLIMVISVAGGLIYIASSILMNTAQYQLGKNYSLFVDIKDHYVLKTEGLYSFIRHPIYLFEILSFFAASLALLNWVLFLWVLFIHLPLYLFRANAEDELLEHYYGDKFIRYKDTVKSFFPGRR